MSDELISRLKVQLQMSGFTQGFDTGYECAEHRTIRDFTLRLLRYRCGDLTEKIQDLVFALPDKTVYSLAEALFEFPSEEELRNWLQAKMEDPVLRRYTQPASWRVFGDG
jgi:hypothetical protein